MRNNLAAPSLSYFPLFPQLINRGLLNVDMFKRLEAVAVYGEEARQILTLWRTVIAVLTTKPECRDGSVAPLTPAARRCSRNWPTCRGQLPRTAFPERSTSATIDHLLLPRSDRPVTVSTFLGC